MTILGLPTARPHPTKLCIICYGRFSLRRMTAGSLYADGQQAFACSAHLANRPEWITGWAVFDYQQRQFHEITAITEGML